MVDTRKLLDAFVGAIGRPDHQNPGQPAAGGVRQQVEKSVTQVTGQSPDQLLQKAKDFAVQNPGLTQTALVGLAGLLFKGRKKGKLTGNLVKLGGLAVIGGLAYKAYQNQQAAKGGPAGASQGTTDSGTNTQGTPAALVSKPDEGVSPIRIERAGDIPIPSGFADRGRCAPVPAHHGGCGCRRWPYR